MSTRTASPLTTSPSTALPAGVPVAVLASSVGFPTTVTRDPNGTYRVTLGDGISIPGVADVVMAERIASVARRRGAVLQAVLALHRDAKAAITAVVRDLRADATLGHAPGLETAEAAQRSLAGRFDPTLLAALAPPDPMVDLVGARVPMADLAGDGTGDSPDDGTANGPGDDSDEAAGEDEDDGINALRSTVVSEVAGVRVVTQVYPLAATLDDIAFSWAEHRPVEQYGTQVVELLRDTATRTVCITHRLLPLGRSA